MIRRLLLRLTLAIVATGSLEGGAVQPADPPLAPVQLSDFFKPGAALQDRNGDGIIDFVDARVALAEHPSAADLAAAADVAARMGFETSAMNLPFVRQPLPAAWSIFIGAKSLPGSSLDALGATALKAGDGVVAAFSHAGGPAIAVLGGNDSGLDRAAVMLAGHLPYVWDQKGPTVGKIADDVNDHSASASAA